VDATGTRDMKRCGAIKVMPYNGRAVLGPVGRARPLCRLSMFFSELMIFQAFLNHLLSDPS